MTVFGPKQDDGSDGPCCGGVGWQVVNRESVGYGCGLGHFEDRRQQSSRDPCQGDSDRLRLPLRSRDSELFAHAL